MNQVMSRTVGSTIMVMSMVALLSECGAATQ
jgi:hypothetical protein